MENRLLIVTISPRPQVKLISWPASRVSIGTETFEEIGAGDTNGFYDFLRKGPHGHIIGVRFMPFIRYSHICDSARVGPGLRISGAYPTASVELFWEEASEYDDDLSVDQFMDYNYIFKNSSQEYAVTFGFLHLPDNEIEDLLSGLAKTGA